MTENSESVTTLAKAENEKKTSFSCDSISLDELLDTEFPVDKWLIKGLIPAGALTVIFGEGGVYKTRLTMNMLLSAVLGKMWLDKFETTEVRVLYINEENKPSKVKEFMNQMGAPRGLPIQFCSLRNFKITEENLLEVLRDCKKHKITVVMFDPLVHMLNGISENDAGAIAELMKLFQILTNEDIAVIILHHARKPSMYGFGGGHNAMRGSTAIFDAADTNIGFTLKTGKTRLVNVAHYKSRGDLPLSPFAVQVETNDDRSRIWFRYAGAIEEKTKKTEKKEALFNRILEIVGGERPYSQSELLATLKSEEFKVNEHSLRRDTLPYLLEDGLIYTIKGPGSTIYYRATQASKSKSLEKAVSYF